MSEKTKLLIAIFLLEVPVGICCWWAYHQLGATGDYRWGWSVNLLGGIGIVIALVGLAVTIVMDDGDENICDHCGKTIERKTEERRNG